MAETDAEAEEPSFLQHAFTSALAEPDLLQPEAAPSFLQQALVGATALAGDTFATAIAGEFALSETFCEAVCA